MHRRQFDSTDMARTAADGRRWRTNERVIPCLYCWECSPDIMVGASVGVEGMEGKSMRRKANFE